MKRTITRKKNKSRKTVLKKKIIEVKNEDDNELPLIKTPMIRKGFYDSQKECKKDETKPVRHEQGTIKHVWLFVLHASHQ